VNDLRAVYDLCAVYDQRVAGQAALPEPR
jgi:hypothetical protein